MYTSSFVARGTCSSGLSTKPQYRSRLRCSTVRGRRMCVVNTVIIGMGGIGTALARTLPAPLIVAGRNPATLRTLAHELSAYDVPVDVTKELEVAALAAEITARGGAKLVIYAVGDIVTGNLTDLSIAAMERIWGANVLGAQLVLKHLAPTLTPDARLYFIGAQANLIEFKGFSAYAAAKAGLETLCRVAGKELKRTVTIVKPPAVNTDFWKRLEQLVPRNAISAERVAAVIVESLAYDAVAELLV